MGREYPADCTAGWNQLQFFSPFWEEHFPELREQHLKTDLKQDEPDGLQHQTFNTKLQQELAALVFEIPKNDKQQQKLKLESRHHLRKNSAGYTCCHWMGGSYAIPAGKRFT
jgi:hypothetical protein